MEGQLFTNEDRYPVPIKDIATPSDICIFGNHFGDNTYYADFAGIAKKYAPQAIMEIGVRFGYSGFAMCSGALAAQEGRPEWKVYYRGCDGEFFGSEFEGAEGYKLYRSNAVARENFRRFLPQDRVDYEFFSVDTQKTPLPPEIVGGTVGTTTFTPWQFDLINVDGDHSYEGALKDCRAVWPLLNVGGIILVDDMSFADVNPAVKAFIRELEDAHGKDVITWQLHRNERDMMFIRRNQ
jgi:hypothetical protein